MTSLGGPGDAVPGEDQPGPRGPGLNAAIMLGGC